MKTKKNIIIIILIIVVAGLACIWFTKNMRGPNLNNNLIIEKKAIESAKDAIKGLANYDETGKITVELEEGQYIVTFPVKLPTPTSLCADYVARVWIDSNSGNVQFRLKH